MASSGPGATAPGANAPWVDAPPALSYGHRSLHKPDPHPFFANSLQNCSFSPYAQPFGVKSGALIFCSLTLILMLQRTRQ